MLNSEVCMFFAHINRQINYKTNINYIVKQLKLFINTFSIHSLVFHQVPCYDDSIACFVVKNPTADKQLGSSLIIVAVEIETFVTGILKASRFMF